MKKLIIIIFLLLAGIAQSQTAYNSYVVVKDFDGTVIVSEYVSKIKIETKLNVKISNSLDGIDTSDCFIITGECKIDNLYVWDGEVYQCLETHTGNPSTNPNLWEGKFK